MKKAKSQKKSGVPVEFTDWITEVCEEVYEYASDALGWSMKRLADNANLHPTTVYKILGGETRNPQALTVWKMAHAVGLEFWFLERTAEVQRAVAKKSEAA